MLDEFGWTEVGDARLTKRLIKLVDGWAKHPRRVFPAPATVARNAWLAVRNGVVGSSYAAAAIGLSPYKSPQELWLEITGRKPSEDLSQKEAIFWGTTSEPILANVYAERTGNKVRRVNAVLQHPEHHHMLANLDRAVGCNGILEIKTAGHHSAGFKAQRPFRWLLCGKNEYPLLADSTHMTSIPHHHRVGRSQGAHRARGTHARICTARFNRPWR